MCWSLRCAKKITFLSLPLGKLKPFLTCPGPMVWALMLHALQANVKSNQVVQVEN